ncbi:MAG: zinc ribbon domain-containing protein [Bryobacteraceae bacterium]
MALINFVSNYDDLSTDRGYQFRFRCDKCGNGHMTQFKPSTLGMAQSILNVAGSLFGGMGSMGNAAYEVQRAVGGKAHDAALAEAVEEARPAFRQCTRCGHWVCAEVCWNAKVNQCENCAPDFQEQLAANQAQAKADAARQQLYDKAAKTDYVSGVDMGADSYVAGQTAVTNTQAKKATCPACGATIAAGAKFCGECGQATVKAGPKICNKCGTASEAKFCPECGNKLA